MGEIEATTVTMKASEARAQWSSLLNAVARRRTRVLVEKSGVPVAAIVSADDLERLARLDEERARDFAVIHEMRAAFADVSAEEIEREVAKAIAEVRAKKRAERARAAQST